MSEEAPQITRTAGRGYSYLAQACLQAAFSAYTVCPKHCTVTNGSCWHGGLSTVMGIRALGSGSGSDEISPGSLGKIT